MDAAANIYIAGHRGLLGRALERRLRARGHANLLLRDHKDLDLTRPQDVDAFFKSERPEYVFLAAARVGGITANQRSPAEFIHTNLMIQSSVIEMSHRYGVRGLVLFGSSCMYPLNGRQPMVEDDLLTGPLEPTSQAYAISKLAGLELCRAYASQHGSVFRAMIPATLYGPHDHFGTDRAHVIPALMHRFHRAKIGGASTVEILGSGRPRREFLHCDDAAEAAIFVMDLDEAPGPLNVGWGEDVAILDLARLIASIVGYGGRIVCDESSPDGAGRKKLDSSRIRQLGWSPQIPLERGLAETYPWYLKWLQDQPDSA